MVRILVTGGLGQIGSELIPYLRKHHVGQNDIVVGSDIRDGGPDMKPFEHLDCTKKGDVIAIIEKYQIDTIYHLVGILSANGEKSPDVCWRLNMMSLKIVLDAARDLELRKVFWPSSIAAFGPHSPIDGVAHQHCCLDPNTIYGVSKVTGELLCAYYHKKFGVDVRSLRVPGIISWKTEAGGGTTDYAVEIFYCALKGEKYDCFVRGNTVLPMMLMDDLVEGIVRLMEADGDRLTIRTSYNFTALSFSAEELADAIISDALNHASIIDGVRLCKAKRFRYANADMEDLEKQLIVADEAGCKVKMIATDGVFSMDGVVAPVGKIVALAKKYDAITMVDDSHATGFMGKTGRGSGEHCNVISDVDVVTSTLGKALGGASGGYTAGRQEIIDVLRQRSRPYLFSNTLAPAIVATTAKVFDMLNETTALRDKLEENTKYFRDEMTKAGFNIKPGVHPIVPIMLFDAKLACDFADEMLKRGIYVIGFSFPVVPKGQARIRVQISAAHTKEMLDRAIKAFVEVGKQLKVVKE